MTDNNRNMILAFALSMLVVTGWLFVQERYFPQPKQVAAAATSTGTAVAGSLPSGDAAAVKLRDPALVLTESPRVAIETPTLKGSINLKGARIDDLVLTQFRQTADKNAPPVVLYAPEGTAQSAFAGYGWAGQGVALPAGDAVWKADGAKLTPTTPVTLSWDNGQGQTFALKLAVDKNYMFSVAQSVTNHGAAPVSLSPYAYVSRNVGSNDHTSSAHVGPVGVFDGKVNYDIDYTNLDGQEASFFGKMFGTTAKPGENNFASKGGWVGFGDKYWLSAVIPAQDAQLNAGFRKDGANYRAGYVAAPVIVGAGQTQSSAQLLFAGAKEVNLLDAYVDTYHVPHLNKAIDWGWFEVLCKPLFHLIHWLFTLTGNFGVAIILTTFVIRGLMFPVAQRQFASMAKMRVVQPKMKALQERFKEDKPALQQEMMKLYKEEKINPAAGCLPVFLQIPVFFSLYKVLSISLEMRHQPFVLWLHDLSVPDPVLFGLFPSLQTYLPGFLALGILPVLLGVSMWLMQRANPMPTSDPAQAQMMALMPWFMMFIFAPLAAGLQLYYVVSNTITIAQQQWFFHKHPVLRQAPQLAAAK